MLSQIVRPLVRTQIRLLANTQATRSTLISTIAQWLGYLGVHAQVTSLSANSGQIQVSLTVGKPESCDSSDWQQILHNLNEPSESSQSSETTYAQMTPKQQSKLQRLLAYLIQVGDPDNKVNWDTLYPQLKTLNLDEDLLNGIKSALKVPQSLDQLLEGLDPDVAALALPKAVSIALLDRRVNAKEDSTLTALLSAMK
ncbi:hypothetical protein H6F98_31640 [Microcoleus sp. FACHB-SPT15]|uniref:hypothetical protein n=1 Tax=Microcoleus sp. FACHB-SPT15 TaxID=2692830 RepID=UPI0017852A81|nr:hypothetical protein [Microcoleus sp. FACHB-SPT15]MBD1809969.1 hypothetical protein [Microcoleus sp. FACHB-SPT15]